MSLVSTYLSKQRDEVPYPSYCWLHSPGNKSAECDTDRETGVQSTHEQTAPPHARDADYDIHGHGEVARRAC